MRYQLLFSFLFCFSVLFSQKTPQVSVNKNLPDCIIDIAPNYKFSPTKSEVSSFNLLLSDKQHLLEQELEYNHIAFKITSIEGVSSMSDIMVEFDPSYQEVVFHNVNIIREENQVNKLDINKIQTIQRETNLENKLLNGNLTAILNLSDVRVGDIIEYAYSVIGENKIHKSKFSTQFELAVGVPVGRLHRRIAVPNDESLRIANHHGAPKAVLKETKCGNEYTWNIENTESVTYDYNVPSWYIDVPFIEATQYTDWTDVAKNYIKYYELSTDQINEVLKEQTIFSNKSSDLSEKINAAIRFVQDEIRYLGFENGLNGFVPRKPIDVLHRRFGDCKDKSVLLVALLKGIGVEAFPILVKSTSGKNLPKRLASPFQFDHCVVGIKFKERLTFVDPTISNQGGDFTTMYLPNYDYGLPLDQKNLGLIKIPSSTKGSTYITETYSLDNVGGGALLEIESVFKGVDADIQRQEIALYSLKNLEKNFEDYYKRVHPSLFTYETVTISDKRYDENTIITRESYRIDSIWNDLPQNIDYHAVEFFPMSSAHIFDPEKVPNRDTPYYLASTNVSHKSIIYFPKAWAVENSSRRIRNDFFDYEHYVDYQNATLTILHKYKTKTDHIPGENLNKYFNDHDEITSEITYQIYHPKEDLTQNSSVLFSWFSVIIFCLVIGLVGYLCYKNYFTYDPINTLDDQWKKSIRGWLILIGFGLIIRPFQYLFALFSANDYFQPFIWDYFFNGPAANTGLGILVFFELVINTALLVFSIYLILLFFKKRTSFPKLVILLFSCEIVFIILDTIVAFSLGEELFSDSEKQETYKDIFKAIVSGAIWIPYFIYSERVKFTFTENLRKKKSINDSLTQNFRDSQLIE